MYNIVVEWLLLSSLLFLVLCNAALPPGYDEEIYCPPSQCLAPKQQHRPGFCGPRTAFWKCCNGKDPDTKPRAWGVKLDLKIKKGLLAKGYHTETCKDATCDRPYENRSSISATSVINSDTENRSSISATSVINSDNTFISSALTEEVNGWDNYYIHGVGLFAAAHHHTT